MLFEIFRGDDSVLGLKIVDETGAVVDITTIRINVTFVDPLSRAKVLVRDSDNVSEILKTDPVNGLADVFLHSFETSKLKVKAYNYDVQLRFLSGVVQTLYTDVLVVKEDQSAP